MQRAVLITSFVLGLITFSAVASYSDDTSWQRQMGEIINSYLKIRVQLSTDSLEGIENESRKITQLAQEVQKSVENKLTAEELQKFHADVSLSAIKTYAELLMRNPQIDVVRKRFSLIGQSLVKYVRIYGMPENIRDNVFVYYCSKFPGYWLQENKEIGNPYLGEKMLSCGRLIANNAQLVEDEAKSKGNLGGSIIHMRH